MISSFNTLYEILPFPILIGIVLWTFSMIFFSLFLFCIFFFTNERSARFIQLISLKELSNEERIRRKMFSCDSLSLISSGTITKNTEQPINSFYLANSSYLNENERMKSFSAIKSPSKIINETKPMKNTLIQLSTRRSIIKDLNSLSTSFKEKKLHQSIDSLFSKDSLAE